jgi:hypothetical protein
MKKIHLELIEECTKMRALQIIFCLAPMERAELPKGSHPCDGLQLNGARSNEPRPKEPDSTFL